MVMISEEKLKNVGIPLKTFINLITKNADFTKEKFITWVKSLPKDEREYLSNKLKGISINQTEVLKVLEEMITPKSSTESFQPTPKKNVPSEYKKGDVLMHPIFHHPYILLEKKLDGSWNCGLITSEERKSITGYKLVRGNRVGNKSIAAKGLLYDMWKYNVYQYESSSYSSIPTYYPSYPFNSMDDDYYLTYGDPLNANGQNSKTANAFKHPFNKTKNDRFSFLSPDTTFNSPTLGTELKLEAVLYGNSLGNFYPVKDHAKYVILSRGGIILIQVLSAFNFAVDFLNFFAEVYKTFQAGVVFTVGTVISTATGVAAFALGAVGNYLRYAKTWQDIILGFGVPQNFAKYYVGVGNYHSHIAVDNNGNKRRALTNYFYMLGGNYSISEQGNSLNLNNYKREDSVYLAINSNSPFIYDNSTHILNPAIADNSRYIISQKGISSDILTNVASFYSSIKYNVPEHINLLSVDIDFNDFYCLKEILKHYKVDIIICEYNSSHLPNEDKIII